MICHQIRKHTSELIDRRLDDAQRDAVLDHLATCAACRQHVEETRAVVAALRAIPAPATPADLFDLAMVAMDRESEPTSTILTRRHFKLVPHYSGGIASIARQVFFDLEFKLIAYSIALFVSFGMFGGLLASMRPMMSLSPFVPDYEQNQIWMTRDQGTVLGMTGIPGEYSMPRIARDSELPGVAENVDFSADDNLILIAEIAPDGRGQIVEVLSGPRDARFVGEIAVAMNRPRSFIPSRAPTGLAVPTRVVLCFERIDVIG